jgi:hypothetical protein
MIGRAARHRRDESDEQPVAEHERSFGAGERLHGSRLAFIDHSAGDLNRSLNYEWNGQECGLTLPRCTDDCVSFWRPWRQSFW